MSEDQRRFQMLVTITVDADSEEKASDFLYEALCLAEGQGLMDDWSEEVVAWHIHGVLAEEPDWTACERCGRLNIEIVDGSAPELCRCCDE